MGKQLRERKAAVAEDVRGLKVTKRSATKGSSRLHSIMIAAKRIREAHYRGEITAEEAARQLSELYNVHRSKPEKRPNSLLSA